MPLDELWSNPLTVFADAVKGHNKRSEDEYEKLAWVTCHLLSPHTKKGRRLTPSKLLGRRESRYNVLALGSTVDEIREAIAELRDD